MKGFLLNQHTNLIISIFSKYHIGLIILTFLLVCLIINNKEKFINMNEKKKKVSRYTLAGILIINFILRRGSFIYYGVYNWKYHLDINFCNFTSIMFLTYSLTGNKKIYEICYYMAFIGPFASILCPSVNFSPLNYSFYSFIILHHTIFIFNIMFMYAEKLEYKKNALKKIIIFLVIYFSTIYLFDFIFNTTYNMPNSFLNKAILDNKVIKVCLNIKYLVMYSIVSINIFIARKFLKYSRNSQSN